MATTQIVVSALDNGGAAIQVTVVVTIVSANIGLFDGSGKSLQRVRSVPTASDGTLTLPVERTADITTDGSTAAVTSTTIQVGDQVYSGLVIPSSGSPVTLASLVPSHTDYTVAVTLGVDDPAEVPVAGLIARAYLSADSINLAGRLILATQPIPATADSMGNLAFHLDRTDQLTPVSIAGEPYYRIVVGSSTFYKKIHGAGTMASQPTATPATGNGSIAAPIFGPSGTGHATGIVPDPGAVAGTTHYLREDATWAVPPGGGGGGSSSFVWSTKTTTYAILTTDTNLLGDATGGAFTFTLPTASGSVQRVTVKRKNAGANAVNIGTTSAQTIDGAAPPYVLGTQWQSATFVSDGTSAWFVE